MRIYEAAHGIDHIETADTHNNLAIVYQKSSRYADAEASYKRALRIKEATHGMKHISYSEHAQQPGNLV